MTLTAITAFRGRYAFLSNFWYAPVFYGSVEYPTVEHAYQAAKSASPTERHEIWRAASPALARRLGRRARYPRADWGDVKLSIMSELVRLKFENHPDLADRLKETAPLDLVEGNTWGDVYWGQCPLGTGENHLGRILMRVRTSLC